MSKKIGLSIAGLVLLMGAPLFAHHGPGEFDRSHPLIVAGTVKEFRWTNPHSWIYVTVPTDKNTTEEWQLEGPSVSVLVRAGWKSNTLVPGQKVKILVSPRKDGTMGGEYLSVTLENGTVLQFGLI